MKQCCIEHAGKVTKEKILSNSKINQVITSPLPLPPKNKEKKMCVCGGGGGENWLPLPM